ncbi:MAG: SBBP repeat-containing protein, partial [bacterium]
YVAGCHWGTDSSYVTIKYNNSGDTMWVRKYRGSGNSGKIDEATALAIDNSGNVYVTGKSYGIGTNYDYTTIKYDGSGDTMWVRRYGGPGNGEDCATGIVLDSSGNVYVTGYSEGNGTYLDYATIKYNGSGSEEWVQRYNGPPGNGDDRAYSIALYNNNYVYVTGMSTGFDISGYATHYATIKYSCVGIEEPSNLDFGMGNGDLKIIKNPFINSTTIKYSVALPSMISLTIYNITGVAVKTLINEKKEIGTYEVNFSGKGLTTGIYFVKLTAGTLKETKKLILMK